LDHHLCWGFVVWLSTATWVRKIPEGSCHPGCMAAKGPHPFSKKMAFVLLASVFAVGYCRIAAVGPAVRALHVLRAQLHQ
jgi:hypothetical protein